MVGREKKLSKQQVRDAMGSDPIVIALRERIAHVRIMMGEQYAQRVKLELYEYIKKNYPDF
jgi:hypothetical protein